jgi:hypothetical protein
MENNFTQESKNDCFNNKISDPKYETKECAGMKVTKITIAEVKGMAQKGSDSINNTAMHLLHDIDNKPIHEVIKKFNHISITDENHNNSNGSDTNSSSNNVSNQEPLIIDNKVISNPIGHLGEICAKNKYSPPDYVDKMSSGPAHSPEFVVECKVIIKGNEFVAEGKAKTKKDAKKSAAENVLRKMSENGFKNGLQSLNYEPEVKTKLINYLSENFSNNSNNSNNSEYNVYIEDNENKEYYKKLDKIAPIIGCDGKFTESKDNKVVLRLVIPHLNNYVLITSFGSSDEGLEVSKEIAAKKAILSLEILNKK